MGLIFAAMAGYDPAVAIPFWQRMAEKSGGGNSSDMFSDHPSDAKRIAAIRQWLPTAEKYYEASGAKTSTLQISSGKTSKKTKATRRRKK